MKKLLCLLLASTLLLAANTVLAETTHEHTWGEWIAEEDGSGHTASCTDGDSAVMTAKHYYFTVALNGISARVCAICGTGRGIADSFANIDKATATPVDKNPGNQRGCLIVRGLEKPFETNESVAYAFTMAFVWNGGLSTFKNKCEISIPLNVELPGSWKLVRVASASGDDSVQNPETWVDIEAAYGNNVLTFVTKTPALYLILSE